MQSFRKWPGDPAWDTLCALCSPQKIHVPRRRCIVRSTWPRCGYCVFRCAQSWIELLFPTFAFATATGNPECRQIFRRQLHAFTHPPAPPRSPFNSHRNATSPKRYKGNRANSVQRARVLLSNTRASDATAATAGISNSASYVLSVSCLFLCGPLRRISVNARFYVQCCLVLWRGGCYGGPLQFPDEIQGQSNWKSSHCWLDSPVVYPDLVLVAVCGRDQCCLSVRFTCLLCVCTVLCSNCGESHRSHQNVRNDEVQVSLRKRTFDMVMDDNLEHYHESLCLLLYFVGLRFIPFNKTVTHY